VDLTVPWRRLYPQWSTALGKDAAEVREQFELQIPAGRTGEGQEAAELALATGASGFLSGQVIPISGG
jgi:hypothetical protein